MTAQIADKFIYRGAAYDVIGVRGGELITPEQFGMTPTAGCTACWRGFYVTYELTSEGLYLRELTLYEKNKNYKPIDGVMPVRVRKSMFDVGIGDMSYSNLNVRVPFTGKIRIAKDFIRERYVHMGFQAPSAYKTVHDVALEDGKVVDILDRSWEVEKLREEMGERPGVDGLMEWIDKSFDLDMDLE